MRVSMKAACALLASLSVLAGCGKSPAPTSTTPNSSAASDTLNIRIGHAAPLTGPQAHLGKDNENAIRLAIDELNSQNFMIAGKKARFELMSEDDMADPRTATQVAQNLVDAGVSGVIGHLNSGTTIPASKIYHDAGLVQIWRVSCDGE